jgi:hypothetical protein
MTRALILGCGPAGLIAAHAVANEGYNFDILSKRPMKSPMLGAQYLHGPIPGITDPNPEATILTVKRGTYEEYRHKVYGSIPKYEKIKASGHNQPDEVGAWDIRSAYDKLWETYGGEVRGEDVDADLLGELIPKYDLIVSAIPAPAICRIGHAFRTVGVWVLPGTCYGIDHYDNTVIANGLESPSWYRSSRIFGVAQTEWPGTVRQPPLPDMRFIQKVIDTNCDCWPNIVKAGRMATWQKGSLAHHAYGAVLNAVILPPPPYEEVMRGGR